jgi:hypothetical protein
MFMAAFEPNSAMIGGAAALLACGLVFAVLRARAARQEGNVFSGDELTACHLQMFVHVTASNWPGKTVYTRRSHKKIRAIADARLQEILSLEKENQQRKKDVTDSLRKLMPKLQMERDALSLFSNEIERKVHVNTNTVPIMQEVNARQADLAVILFNQHDTNNERRFWEQVKAQEYKPNCVRSITEGPGPVPYSLAGYLSDNEIDTGDYEQFLKDFGLK